MEYSQQAELASWDQSNAADALLDGRAAPADTVSAPFWAKAPDLGCERVSGYGLGQGKANQQPRRFITAEVVYSGLDPIVRDKYFVVRLAVEEPRTPEDTREPIRPPCLAPASFFLFLVRDLLGELAAQEFAGDILQGPPTFIDSSGRYMFTRRVEKDHCVLELRSAASWQDTVPMKSAEAPFGRATPPPANPKFDLAKYRW